MSEELNRDNYYMYKGKPLVREGNTICYGSMNDKYVLNLMILSEKEISEAPDKKYKVPDSIMVQIVSTDTSKPFKDRVIKSEFKNGLYDAMEVGIVWLNSANK